MKESKEKNRILKEILSGLDNFKRNNTEAQMITELATEFVVFEALQNVEKNEFLSPFPAVVEKAHQPLSTVLG